MDVKAAVAYEAGTPLVIETVQLDGPKAFEVLVEIHSYYREQIEIARRVDRVYDFALPPLVLHALHQADAAPLKATETVTP